MTPVKISTIVVLTTIQVATISAKSRPAREALHITDDFNYEAEKRNLSNIASIFSPRMDFDQWKPLTGRGDPLRNDPTYDYEPPLLDRVHYWADDTRLEREHYPERKSEVLMLGVSSRRPSIGSRQQSMVPRRHQRPPPPLKYEDNTYKINEPFPMTILVPPPPPPRGIPSQYSIFKDKIPSTQTKLTTPIINPTVAPIVTTVSEHDTVSYALQESNLIYQSSTTNLNNWVLDFNKTNSLPNVVSKDYAGWGPTTPFDDINIVNETHNLISIENLKLNDHPYSFYKPMLSEAPPPPQVTISPLLLPTFIPTAPPTTAVTHPVINNTTISIWWDNITTTESIKDNQDYYEDTTTEKQTTYKFEPTPSSTPSSNPQKGMLDMLGPMMTMPLVNGPERPEDNLYAYASENLQIYKEQPTEDISQIETMQTMQPPPPVKFSDGTTVSLPNQLSPHILSSLKQPSTHTHDPYLHMRYTTPMPTISLNDLTENIKSTTEVPTIPMYLIIQGHSKVKTYSSKPRFNDENDSAINEISKPNETNEVKHLHPIKEQKKGDKTTNRTSKSHSNLKALVDNGLGSIEIQEADVGIKYDVSDGSEVPVEIYRKGIIDSDENAYRSHKKSHEKRNKRQIELEDLVPFDEDTIEEYVFNFLQGKRNETGITGLIAKAVTSDAASVVDDLEDEDDEER